MGQMMTGQGVFALVVIVNCHIFVSSHNSAERLYNDLLLNYTKGVRPGTDYNHSLNVELFLTVSTLLEINAVDKIMSVNGFFNMLWRDERLQWNKTEYDGHSSILIDPSLLWTPRILLINPARRFQVFGTYSSEVRVQFDGYVFWVAGDMIETNCNINIRNYPFDIQTCDISITPFGYTENEVNLSVSFSTQFTEFPLGNGEWDHVQTTTTDWSLSVYNVSNFTLQYKRKHHFVLTNIIEPVLILNVISLAVFRIPPNCGERISFAITVFLSYIVFLTIITDNIPKTSSPMSLLSLYLIAKVSVSACITVSTVFIVQVSHKSPRTPIPERILYLLAKSNKMQNAEPKWADNDGNKLDNTRTRTKSGRAELITGEDEGRGSSLSTHCSHIGSKQPTWEEVAIYFDRVLFFFFLSVMLLFTVLLFTFICTNLRTGDI
ncbi:hypothetical protein CHS0354_030971 [Potamilus streckersoni]|uniref:Uncharacterized protein n=1 Tax=Potamilus streckersoni TaxID=2493646 RepID=A0AAE0SEU2_9BIVA|nr:hypothetical protein CHS0354_030971 [Potamilus streckersoni]